MDASQLADTSRKSSLISTSCGSGLGTLKQLVHGEHRRRSKSVCRRGSHVFPRGTGNDPRAGSVVDMISLQTSFRVPRRPRVRLNPNETTRRREGFTATSNLRQAFSRMAARRETLRSSALAAKSITARTPGSMPRRDV